MVKGNLVIDGTQCSWMRLKRLTGHHTRSYMQKSHAPYTKLEQKTSLNNGKCNPEVEPPAPANIRTF